MLELYLKDPADLTLMKGVKGLSVSAKLYELSMLVKNWNNYITKMER